MSGKETWKKWRIGMTRIKQGDLVRFRAYNGRWAHLYDRTGIVVSKPKEKPFQMTPTLVSMECVVDVLIDENVVTDVSINCLEKKPPN